jgi:hypothetical protein
MATCMGHAEALGDGGVTAPGSGGHEGRWKQRCEPWHWDCDNSSTKREAWGQRGGLRNGGRGRRRDDFGNRRVDRALERR